MADGTQDQTPEFTVEGATSFLTEHGVDPKSLEGVDEDALKSQWESARSIADKASARALEAAEKARAEAAPAEYTFDAGKNDKGEALKVDEGIADLVSTYAKENKMSAEMAQSLYQTAGQFRDGVIAGMQEQVKAMHEQWAKDAEAHKEYGGPEFKANMAVAQKWFQALPDGMRKVLEDSKLINHPDIILHAFHEGKKLSSTPADRGGGGGGGLPTGDARGMFPNSQMNP